MMRALVIIIWLMALLAVPAHAQQLNGMGSVIFGPTQPGIITSGSDPVYGGGRSLIIPGGGIYGGGSSSGVATFLLLLAGGNITLLGGGKIQCANVC